MRTQSQDKQSFFKGGEKAIEQVAIGLRIWSVEKIASFLDQLIGEGK